MTALVDDDYVTLLIIRLCLLLYYRLYNSELGVGGRGLADDVCGRMWCS